MIENGNRNKLLNNDQKEEQRLLYDFVKTHYAITPNGELAYQCNCRYPSFTCSSLQHHPDLDAIILEFTTTGDLSSRSETEEEEELPPFPYRALVVFVAIVSSSGLVLYAWYELPKNDFVIILLLVLALNLIVWLPLLKNLSNNRTHAD